VERTLVIELFAALFQRLPTAMVVVLTFTLLVIALVRRWPSILSAIRWLAPFSKHRVRILISLSAATVIAVGGELYGLHAGFIPYITFEGRLEAVRPEDVAGARVIAFRNDRQVADGVGAVDPSGYFSVNNLYRDGYRFVAFKITEAGRAMVISEFSRDLRASDDQLRDYKFPLEFVELRQLAVLNFDSARSELDVTALQQLEDLRSSAAIPSDIEELLWFGHADDRGGESANFALGLRRVSEVFEKAVAAIPTLRKRRNLLASFGETWPAALGSGARALAENRRVVLYGLSHRVTIPVDGHGSSK
jgi:hypothetical protein